MSGDSKPEVKYDPRFLYIDYETEIIRQAFLLHKTVKRTAGLTDLSNRRVRKALERAGQVVRRRNEPMAQ